MAATLLWFTNDLRTHDNAALLHASTISQPLICVYVIDRAWLKTNQYGTKRIGIHRLTTLLRALNALDQRLKALGQRLNVIVGDPVTEIASLVIAHGVDDLIGSELAGSYEKRDWRLLAERFPHMKVSQHATYTLFNQPDITRFPLFPSSFSKFRKQVGVETFRAKAEDVSDLPPPLLTGTDPLKKVADALAISVEDVSQNGGETEALQYLHHYFNTNAASSYKETRNELSGYLTSTGFSLWLSQGSLSVCKVIERLRDYENVVGRNSSTEWIEFELLWREYFQWYAHNHGKQLFRFKGIGKRKPLTSYYAHRFHAWCSGKTPWPLVNALMNELNATGYMSNRGRQIVASALVNELQLDWRCGASYFEQQLIDYDVASNWGNWQYIAGVGADTRGGRHFNIEKQNQLYDPEGHYCRQWSTAEEVYQLDYLDAADWPIQNP